jgi:hypothetical protein
MFKEGYAQEKSELVIVKRSFACWTLVDYWNNSMKSNNREYRQETRELAGRWKHIRWLEVNLTFRSIVTRCRALVPNLNNQSIMARFRLISFSCCFPDMRKKIRNHGPPRNGEGISPILTRLSVRKSSCKQSIWGPNQLGVSIQIRSDVCAYIFSKTLLVIDRI